jgi:hypothetical protein
VRIDPAVVRRLHDSPANGRWRVPVERLAEILSASADKGLGGRPASTGEVERYVSSLHLDDLVLSSACMMGNETAWEYFLREYRPLLYRAADAMDATVVHASWRMRLWRAVRPSRQEDHRSIASSLFPRTQFSGDMVAHGAHAAVHRRTPGRAGATVHLTMTCTICRRRSCHRTRARPSCRTDAGGTVSCHRDTGRARSTASGVLLRRRADPRRNRPDPSRTRSSVPGIWRGCGRSSRPKWGSDFGRRDSPTKRSECFTSVTADAGTLDVRELRGSVPDSGRRQVPARKPSAHSERADSGRPRTTTSTAWSGEACARQVVETLAETLAKKRRRVSTSKPWRHGSTTARWRRCPAAEAHVAGCALPQTCGSRRTADLTRACGRAVMTKQENDERARNWIPWLVLWPRQPSWRWRSGFRAVRMSPFRYQRR